MCSRRTYTYGHLCGSGPVTPIAIRRIHGAFACGIRCHLQFGRGRCCARHLRGSRVATAPELGLEDVADLCQSQPSSLSLLLEAVPVGGSRKPGPVIRFHVPPAKRAIRWKVMNPYLPIFSSATIKGSPREESDSVPVCGDSAAPNRYLRAMYISTTRIPALICPAKPTPR